MCYFSLYTMRISLWYFVWTLLANIFGLRPNTHRICNLGRIGVADAGQQTWPNGQQKKSTAFYPLDDTTHRPTWGVDVSPCAMSVPQATLSADKMWKMLLRLSCRADMTGVVAGITVAGIHMQLLLKDLKACDITFTNLSYICSWTHIVYRI